MPDNIMRARLWMILKEQNCALKGEAHRIVMLNENDFRRAWAALLEETKK